MKNFVQNLTVLLAVIILVSCGASTQLTSSWSNKKVESKHYNKLGVIAIFPNESNRYLTERALASDFKAQNINAVPTYEIFPFAGKAGQVMAKSENPEALKERIKNKVKENNFDAIMIITVLDSKKEKRFVHDDNSYDMMGGTGYYGTPRVVPGAAAMPFTYGAYYNYYSYNMANAYTSGYYVEDVTFFLECNLYDVANEELIWSGRTKSMNIKSAEEEAPKFADMVVKDIMSKKILIP
jgi:hypothetical protein